MKNYLLLLLVLIHVSALAQSAYQKGYVITASGDSIAGFIKYRSPKNMALSCKFRLTESGSTVKYSPDDLKAYRFYNESYYISKTIKNDIGEEVKVFLEYLVNGKADLYYFKGTHGLERYFLQSEGQELIELKNTQAEKILNNKNYIVENKEYIKTLSDAFSSAPQIQSELTTSEFNHKNLITLTQNYHNYVCNEYDCMVYKKKVDLLWSAGFVTGTIATDVNFKVKFLKYNFLKNENFTPKSSVAIAALLCAENIFGFDRNISLNAQLGYQKNIYASQNLRIELNNIRVPLYATYTFPISKIRPFVSAGIVNTLWLSKSVSLGHGEFAKNNLENSIGFYQISALLSAGLEYKPESKNRYFISLNYEKGSGMQNYDMHTQAHLSSKTTLLGVYVGFRHMLK